MKKLYLLELEGRLYHLANLYGGRVEAIARWLMVAAVVSAGMMMSMLVVCIYTAGNNVVTAARYTGLACTGIGIVAAVSVVALLMPIILVRVVMALLNGVYWCLSRTITRKVLAWLGVCTCWVLYGFVLGSDL